MAPSNNSRLESIAQSLQDLMLIPGLSGHEGRVRRAIAKELDRLGLPHTADRLGNLIATLSGTKGAPSIMLYAHIDQLGLIVRKLKRMALFVLNG